MKPEAFLAKHIASSRLEQVTPNRSHAERLMAEARGHLAFSEQAKHIDLPSAYAVTYDAARKALAAYLAVQGLRVTFRGGHQMLFDAVRVQMTPQHAPIVKQFGLLRSRRSQVEYPADGTPQARMDEVEDAYARASEIVALIELPLPTLTPFGVNGVPGGS